VNRPFSESCEQNQADIFATIKPYLQGEILEIASGTGQHAVFFARMMPSIVWQTSDVGANLAGIRAWLEYADLENLLPPLELDVCGGWPVHRYDLIFTANSFHIMDEATVEKTFDGMPRCLESGGKVIAYGPFNYHGGFTSLSNAQFDGWLKQQNRGYGIRDFEWIDRLAKNTGLQLIDDVAMPVNNRILVWQYRTY